MFKASNTAALISAISLFVAAQRARAQQDPFPKDQRKAAAGVLHVEDPESKAGGASAQELAFLLKAQNARVALPQNLSAYSQYFEANPLVVSLQKGRTPELGVLLLWNLVALDLTAIDHTLLEGPTAAGHEQYGPPRTSRVLAIAHLSMYEAVNAVYNKFESYKDLQTKFTGEFLAAHPELAGDGAINPQSVSVSTAIIAAGHDALAALYPKKKGLVDIAESITLQRLGLGTDPSQLTGPAARGYELGQAAAKSVLEDRGYDAEATAASGISTFSDGSSEPDPLATDPRYANDGPDRWHPDPIHPTLTLALGGNWMHVRPFVIPSSDAFRPAAEPAKDSSTFIAAYKMSKKIGGDPTLNLQPPRATTPTQRTKNQSIIGDFWAYDGTALLCAPPRLYNEIATSIALREKPIKSVENMARFLALVNLALADGAISAWDAKYAFRLGRPVTYIRSLSVDNTPEGTSMAGWTPKGAPVSNGSADGKNFTPPFPSFPSGHATLGGSVFQMFREYWYTKGSDEDFSFMSDEFNGHNYPPGGTTPRPAITNHFRNFTQAESQNAESRIYLGVHWQFDADTGIEVGNEVATYIFQNALQPK